jgi:hypothetical protein
VVTFTVNSVFICIYHVFIPSVSKVTWMTASEYFLIFFIEMTIRYRERLYVYPESQGNRRKWLFSL